jgi:RNA polymerase sigma factor (sigma-70 family)
VQTILTVNTNNLKTINWEQLYVENAPKLKGLCRRYVGDACIADDLVHETFATAIEKISTYRGMGAVEGWIRKIAINKALLHLREKQHAPISVETITNPIAQESEMEQTISKIRETIERATFTSEELLSVIDRLPQHHKVVFNLYVIDGYSHKQIAEMMQISTGTSKSHLSRARKKAQELLYAEASMKQPEEKTKRRSLLFLLGLQPNPVDQLFRKGLSGFELEATAPSTSIGAVPKPNIKLGTSFTTKAIASVSILAATSVGIVLYSMHGNNPIKETQNISTELPMLYDTIQPKNSIDIKLQDDSSTVLTKAIPKQSTDEKPAKQAPVIIRKTIVVHDTIRLERPSTE